MATICNICIAIYNMPSGSLLYCPICMTVGLRIVTPPQGSSHGLARCPQCSNQLDLCLAWSGMPHAHPLPALSLNTPQMPAQQPAQTIEVKCVLCWKIGLLEETIYSQIKRLTEISMPCGCTFKHPANVNKQRERILQTLESLGIKVV